MFRVAGLCVCFVHISGCAFWVSELGFCPPVSQWGGRGCRPSVVPFVITSLCPAESMGRLCVIAVQQPCLSGWVAGLTLSKLVRCCLCVGSGLSRYLIGVSARFSVAFGVLAVRPFREAHSLLRNVRLFPSR